MTVRPTLFLRQRSLPTVARSAARVMVKRVRPARQEPVLGMGLRDRHNVEAGVCGSHQGPGVDDSHTRGRIYVSNPPHLDHHTSPPAANTGRTIYV